MINKVILIGNIGQDPEVRHLENGSVVARFSVATNENYKDKSGEWQKITEWHNVTCWRALAEMVERNYKKGMMVYVEGKLSTRKWQDSEGRERRTTDVVANTLRMLERRENTGFGGPSMPGAADEPKAFPPANEAPGVQHTEKINDTMADDDLPF